MKMHFLKHFQKKAGAALDCFNDEPIIKPNRFCELENVILANIAWTQELFRDKEVQSTYD